MTIYQEKICSKCKETKHLEEFYIREGTKDGYRNDCKKCCKVRVNDYRNTPENKQKIKEYKQLPIVKDKNRIRNNEKYQQPEIKQRRKEYREIPEVKKRILEYRATPEKKEYAFFKQVFKRYGINKDQYYQMLEEHKNSCKICRKHQSVLKKRLSVDHCHKTGKVRGFLCHKCNIILGAADDSCELLLKAIEYLQTTK